MKCTSLSERSVTNTIAYYGGQKTVVEHKDKGVESRRPFRVGFANPQAVPKGLFVFSFGKCFPLFYFIQ